MAFFGVELRSAKPFKYTSDKLKGRLRISQATLGVGSATNKNFVQCTVGDKSPVFLCVLIPDKTESCQLDLEFDEAEDVVFSVIGPRSVYLTGYYLSNNKRYNMTSDTESYGEDVGNTGSEKSIHSADEDEYDDSFINDDEPEVVPDSSVSSDGDLVILEDDTPKNRKGNPKRLKKRYQVIESDDSTSLEDSEDDGKYLLSIFKTKKPAKNASSEAGENTNKLAVATSGETEIPACDDSKLKEKAQADKKECDNSVDTRDTVKVNDILQNMPVNDLKDQKQTLEIDVASVNCEKPKKKRKERSKDVKICETESSNHQEVKAEQTKVETDNMQQDHLIKHETRNPITDMDIDAHPAESGSEKGGPKSKKRRKALERGSVKGNHEQSQDVNGKNSNADNVKDVPATDEDQIQSNIISNEISSALVADGCLAEKKTKTKKKKKSKDQVNVGEDKVLMNSEDKHLDAMSSEVRTLSNGLIIEELAKGEPDGKIAAQGKKVKIYYTAKLKENGHVFDSNIGKNPYRFRLGGEGIIEGWNLGLDGMLVGGKRRLVIPPSMGYGNQGTGENVPPNSWLVYEVELVDVRK